MTETYVSIVFKLKNTGFVTLCALQAFQTFLCTQSVAVLCFTKQSSFSRASFKALRLCAVSAKGLASKTGLQPGRVGNDTEQYWHTLHSRPAPLSNMALWN